MSTVQAVDTFQTVFEQQKRHFASGVTRRYEVACRAARIACRELVAESEPALQRAIAHDVKTARSGEDVRDAGLSRMRWRFKRVGIKFTAITTFAGSISAASRDTSRAADDAGVVWVRFRIRPLRGRLDHRAVQRSAPVAAQAGHHGSGGWKLLPPQAEHGAQPALVVTAAISLRRGIPAGRQKWNQRRQKLIRASSATTAPTVAARSDAGTARTARATCTHTACDVSPDGPRARRREQCTRTVSALTWHRLPRCARRPWQLRQASVPSRAPRCNRRSKRTSGASARSARTRHAGSPPRGAVPSAKGCPGC